MKLLIIDPNMSLSSPAMKGIVRSLPALRAAGVETEAWCWTCDAGLEIDRVCYLPRLGNIRFLALFAFGWIVFWRAWWLYRVRKQPRPDVIYTVAWYHKACDVCHVHFSSFDWEARQKLLGTHSLRDVVERVVNLLSLVRARSFLRNTTAKTVLCVSDAVAADIRHENPDLHLEVLPNSYDPQRFHLGVRSLWRDATREKLGYTHGEHVFIFVSTGHYRRKGLLLAVDALAIVRKRHPSARLLIVGGLPQRLESVKKSVRMHAHDHEQWVTYTGMVPDVEKYFAAADAFLFPSYSEAFALVEIEAAACGLPLFLTPHHGSEMILEDGVNGRRIEFDADKAAAVITEFIEGRWAPTGHSLKRAIDSETYAARLLESLQATLTPSPAR